MGETWTPLLSVAHRLFNRTTTDGYPTASEDFDHLLFEFGLELDEDVRGIAGTKIGRINSSPVLDNRGG